MGKSTSDIALFQTTLMHIFLKTGRQTCAVGPWLITFLLMLPATGFADIATLREKGPFSGSAFSNPGVVGKENAGLKVAMVSAEVKINLRRGEGDQLAADCTAVFQLEDHADTVAGEREFLVAFPVTGLSSKVVTGSNFVVEVDGGKPATVFRQTISISRREAELRDTPVFGQLEERFQPRNIRDEKTGWMPWGIKLADQSVYPNAYVWVQKTTPGKKTQVKVTYTVGIRPQSIRYSKSYNSSADDSEVIPFADLQLAGWEGQYYFFDYVLVSGSTWDGPIGKETVTLTVDPQLGIAAGMVQCDFRQPAAYRWSEPETKRSRGEGFERGDDGPTWTITGEPNEDMLFVVPASAIRRALPAAAK